MPAPVKGNLPQSCSQRRWLQGMFSGLSSLSQQVLRCVQHVSAADFWPSSCTVVPQSLNTAIYMQRLPLLPLLQVCGAPVVDDRLLLGCTAWLEQVCRQTTYHLLQLQCRQPNSEFHWTARPCVRCSGPQSTQCLQCSHRGSTPCISKFSLVQPQTPIMALSLPPVVLV